MAVPISPPVSALHGPDASPLFLREAEIRRGVELLYFGYSHLTRAIDEELAAQGLGRAHHRALYFIARQPDLTVSELLKLLAITKQSLGRVLTELSERQLVEHRPGTVEPFHQVAVVVRIARGPTGQESRRVEHGTDL